MKKLENKIRVQDCKPENCNGQIYYRTEVVDTWIVIHRGKADMASVKYCLAVSSEFCGKVMSCMEIPAAVEMVHLSSQEALNKVRHQPPLSSHCIN